METGRRNTGEVNLSEVEERPKTFTDLDMAKTLTRRKMKRSVIDEEEEYGDYADYNDGEQDYPESNTLYEDAPEVTIAPKRSAYLKGLKGFAAKKTHLKEEETVATPKFVSQPKVSFKY